MKEWTAKEENQKTINEELEKFQIFVPPKQMLSHYTSREVFWKIIDNEVFLARHIHFSNDVEENKIGLQKISRILEEQNLKMDNKINDTLSFMICFCGKRDLLSQWRGYAQDGIEMVFDFSKGLYSEKEGFSTYHCLSVLNREADEEQYMSKVSDLENGEIVSKPYYVGAILSPYQVFYVNSDENENDLLRENIAKLSGEKLMNGVTREECRQSFQQGIKKLIPYIKNDKFTEEDEYRLIFDLKTLIRDSQFEILEQKYVYLEKEGLRKPNIRIKFGNPMDQENAKTRVFYSNSEYEDMLTRLGEELEKSKIMIEIIRDEQKYPIDNNEIYISASKFQEQIYLKIKQGIIQQSLSANVKIWCDGHLPLRKVIVGPSKDAQYMAQSIREYIRTKYWLRDVDVEISKIPLRT